MKKLIFAGAFAVSIFCSNAMAICTNLDKPVLIYLKNHPNWTLLQVEQLESFDQTSWKQYHKELCPGLAKVDLEGNDHYSYALALVQIKNGKTWEQLILINPPSKPHNIITIVKPYIVAYPSVVYSNPPTTVVEFFTSKKTAIKHDSFVFETMEASANQYYWEGGKLKNVLISD